MMPAAASDMFRALSDPTRLSLFQRLVDHGALSVKALTEEAQVSQPAVSQHLAILRNAGLVAERRDGRRAIYHAKPEALRPLIDWVSHYAAFWEVRIGRLAELVDEVSQTVDLTEGEQIHD